MDCRDWLSTLWPASYKGVPFYFEQDESQGGRDNVKHVFPHRDDPYIEDMGRSLRYYAGSAYVHGDNADDLARALETALESEGAGTLVVPYFGPVTVHCEAPFRRVTAKDQMGYVAFELKFVRAGVASALISVPLLQNVAYAAADGLAAAIAAAFPAAVTARGEPDYVIAAATDTLAAGAGALDVLRQSYAVDPAVSASLRDTIADLVAAAPAALDGAAIPGAPAAAVVASLVSAVRGLSDGLAPASAQRAMVELLGAFPAAVVSGVPYLSASAARAAANAEAAARALRLAALTGYAEAVLRTTFGSRPEGVTARAAIAERFEAEADNTTGSENAALFVAIETLAARVIDWITKTINDLAPVVVVETAIPRPSLDLAWTLYADPARADELVSRNRVRHPSFMPLSIEALAR
ncbi:DNA circularization N-terminal domain-containing protein [Rhodopseudomonas sp. BR0G17]|uniref:DNA circularization N-terminal domain-containing protein n=1 Tax=Rhodopseudomonas sp. BR0G17 TaxID=2269368 RepID=UPI0013DEA315|nr:DNA circularization N-terminal domain-containing protein [Rhodopseudomonas sp. BR0G17]